jgi:hypothetical protein
VSGRIDVSFLSFSVGTQLSNEFPVTDHQIPCCASTTMHFDVAAALLRSLNDTITVPVTTDDHRRL